jgi:hypothetical protein
LSSIRASIKTGPDCPVNTRLAIPIEYFPVSCVAHPSLKVQVAALAPTRWVRQSGSSGLSAAVGRLALTNIAGNMADEIKCAEEQVMVDGKDELAAEQLDAVSGGIKARLVEVDTSHPVTKVPTPSGPVPIPYPNTASNKPT